jgi:hypothetical protein
MNLLTSVRSAQPLVKRKAANEDFERPVCPSICADGYACNLGWFAPAEIEKLSVAETVERAVRDCGIRPMRRWNWQ